MSTEARFCSVWIICCTVASIVYVDAFLLLTLMPFCLGLSCIVAMKTLVCVAIMCLSRMNLSFSPSIMFVMSVFGSMEMGCIVSVGGWSVVVVVSVCMLIPSVDIDECGDFCCGDGVACLTRFCSGDGSRCDCSSSHKDVEALDWMYNGLCGCDPCVSRVSIGFSFVACCGVGLGAYILAMLFCISSGSRQGGMTMAFLPGRSAGFVGDRCGYVDVS